MSPKEAGRPGARIIHFCDGYRSFVRGMSLFGLPAPAVTSVMNPPQKDRACRNVIKGNENAFPGSVKSAE
jgi:hypothetical protein